MFACNLYYNHLKSTAMKHLVLYLMLLLAIPATAQSGLFGTHPHHSHEHGEHHHHGSLMQHGPNEHPYGPQAMNPEDFEVALRFISKETFDSNRLDTAKEIVGKNWVSARQIAAICGLFTYDSNRLEFAKFAYASCVDKGMYFLLDETFTYRFSKEELHEFTSRQ